MCIYIDTPHIYCVTFVTPVTLKRTVSALRSLHPIDLLRYRHYTITLYIYICIYIYMYVCMYVYIYI